MRLRTLTRKGFSLVELMLVSALIFSALVIFSAIVWGWGWGKASVEVVGANRAYDAVMAAHYMEPELTYTYDDDYATYCHAADDAVGYNFLATPEDGGERVALTVCCGSAMSAKPCTVRPAGQ
ncbi:MAG: prepilin-type N-terminal cleavage/methylation domain-containing protein [Patescibacteria group bacterium]